MRITRLGHICLGTIDLDRVVSFYSDLLGCRVIHEFRTAAGERYGVFLLVGEGTFLEFFRDTTIRSGDGRFRHLCLQVEDIEQAAHSLRASGFEPVVRRGRTDHVLLCEVRDPDGNLVEFHQYDSPSMQWAFLPTRETGHPST